MFGRLAFLLVLSIGVVAGPAGAQVVTAEAEGAVASQIAPGSRAAPAGLEAGDVITVVNRQPVETIRDIDRALKGVPGAVALTIWRDGRTMQIVLRS